MSRKHTEAARQKISDGVRLANQNRAQARRVQEEVNLLLTSFAEGAGARTAKKVFRAEERVEYVQIGEGEVPKHEGMQAAIDARWKKPGNRSE